MDQKPDTRDDAFFPPKADKHPQTPEEPSQQQIELKKPRKSWARWLWLLILLPACLGAYFEWFHGGGTMASTAPSTPTSKAGAGGGRGVGAPTEVVAARVRRGNIGVYSIGLGQVTPIYTVTLKSRVDGELMRVNFNEGDIVHQGDLLAEIDARPFEVALEQAEGQLARDQALLENAHVDEKRYEGLLELNAVPEQQVATQKALVSQYEGVVKTDQGQIDSAKLNLIYCRITAPITGRVGLRLVDPGNIVHATDANGLVVITQLQPMSVIFAISEGELPPVLKKLQAGEKLKAEAWDSDNKKKMAEGILKTVDNVIDPTTGTIKLRAEFENKDYALFPNQFINVRLLVEEKHNVALIATAAVQMASDSKYVYLVKPDSTVTVRQITTGVVEGDDSEITSGLNPGDVVVMTGVDKLNEGTRVRAQIEGKGGVGQGNEQASTIPGNSPRPASVTGGQGRKGR